MASGVSSTSNLPWNWVLGALSCSSKVDTSLLIDIVKGAPEITNELEKKVREMVTLRILENLSNEENQINNNGTPDLGQKEELSSNDTEDVVQHILAEMSATDPEIVGQEVLNWDVQSFILHKRTSLPMCALQKIKEAILKGGSSVFKSLRERSGLSVRTECDYSTNVNHGHFDCLGQGLEEGSREICGNGHEESQSDLPNLAPPSTNITTIPGENLGKQSSNNQFELDDGSTKIVKLDSNITAGRVVKYSNGSPTCLKSGNASDGRVQCNGTDSLHFLNEVGVESSTSKDQNGGLEANSRDPNLLLCKRNSAEKSVDDFDSHAEVTKGFKPDANVTGENLVLNPISSPVDGIPTIPSDMVNEDIPTGKCNIVKAAPLRATECNQSPHDTEWLNAETKQLSPSHDADDHLPSLPEVEVYNNQVDELPALLNGQKDGEVGGTGNRRNLEPRTVNYASLMEKEIFRKHPANVFGGSFPINVSNGDGSNDDISSSPDLEMTSGSEEHDDDRICGSLKKDPLLSLHGTYSQESFATQPSSCIKCNGDGELLVCSSNSCQLVVHQSCLRSAPTFDESGKFQCPFCAYARSISECLEIKKKNSLARKNLAIFIGAQTDCQLKKSTSTLDGAEHGQSKGTGEFDIDNEGKVGVDLGNKALKSHPLGYMENRNQAEPPKSCLDDNLLHEKKRSPHRSAKHSLGRSRMGQQLQSPQQLTTAELVEKSDNVPRNSNSTYRNEKKGDIRRKDIQEISKSTLPLEPLSKSNAESFEEDNEKYVTSRHSKKRARNSVKHSNESAIPRLRRKPSPWSKEEEEKLKEGLQKMACINDSSLPWSSVLSYGADTFQSGRTPRDLRDKWRNMCRASSLGK